MLAMPWVSSTGIRCVGVLLALTDNPLSSTRLQRLQSRALQGAYMEAEGYRIRTLRRLFATILLENSESDLMSI